MPTRRTFLHTLGAVAVAPALTGLDVLRARARRAGARFHVGVTDWNLHLEGDPKAVALAHDLGFDGVQISLSNRNGKDWVGDDVLDQFVAESKRLALPIASVCLNILHRNYLKSDPLGPRRVADAIPMARRVGVEVILLPFFGPGALKTPAEMDFVGDALKELGPDAEKAGVILGLEDTILGKGQRAGHGAVAVARRAHLLRRRQLDEEWLRGGGRDPVARQGADLRGAPEGQPALPRRGNHRLSGHRWRAR